MATYLWYTRPRALVWFKHLLSHEAQGLANIPWTTDILDRIHSIKQRLLLSEGIQIDVTPGLATHLHHRDLCCMWSHIHSMNGRLNKVLDDGKVLRSHGLRTIDQEYQVSLVLSFERQ